MALSITVHGQGTFTASMEEGPVTFTASIGSVGPQGATGPTGPAGVVSATAPITYNSGTQTVGISATPTFTSVTATTGNLTTVNLTTATFADATSQTTAFVGEARKVYITARNATGSTIAKGKVVYLSGGTGNVPNVSLALADAESTSSRTIGITAEAISNNSNGKVITSGVVENIDTSAFNDGDTVYLSATTAGGLTTTLPAQPLHGVVIGIVTRANPSVGSIEVSINNYQELKELSDVSVSDRANNDGLFWESSSSTWRSKTIAEVLGYTPLQLSSLSASSPISYNSGTGVFSFDSSGFLLKASNLSDLSSASTARTNLGLGTMAVETASDYLTKAGNLSGLASASSARTNLGLGTMATETAANYALLASPTFTGDPKAPTPATSDNDTSIATTAFVNAYCPSASTSTAGKVQLATTAEALAGTDTAKAVTSAGVYEARDLNQYGEISLVGPTWSTATSGGAFASNQRTARFVNAFTATGYGTVYIDCVNNQRGGSASAGINWAKKAALTCRVAINPLPSSANTVLRIMLGKTNTSGVAGDLAVRGIGVKISNGAMTLMAHNGTSLTTNATSYTPTAAQAFDLKVESDAAGTVTAYVNGTSVGTCTGGPTTAGSANQNGYFIEDENTNTVTTGSQLYTTNHKVSFAL